MTASEATHWSEYQRTGLTTLERLELAHGELYDTARRRLIQAEHPDGLVVVAYGKPAPQGSKVRGHHGGVYESSADTLKPWREAVKYATIAASTVDPFPMITRPIPVQLELVTSKRRPDNHWRTGAHAGELKGWALDARPAATPDGDKLERAILDALKWGGAYEDDAQVTDMHWRKRYATPGSPDPWILDRPGAVIVVRGAT